MAAKTNRKKATGFWWLLLIPIFASIIWCAYYGLDQKSILNLLKVILPVYVIAFLLGEFVFWLFPRKLSNSFKIGFWIGSLLIAPHYMHLQMLFIGSRLLVFPATASYVAYLITAILTGTFLGLTLWSIIDLIKNLKNSHSKGKFAFSRVILFLVTGILAFLPLILGPRILVDPNEQFISLRAFEEREPIEQPKHKVIVMGIDGADWSAMKPLVDDGKLPNLKKLMANGQWGVLESTTPINSPTVWATAFSGMEPSVHGLVSWLNSYSTNRRVKGVWNILSEYDLKSTIMNIPGTYPPEEFNGREVSGFPAPNQTMNIYGWVIASKSMGQLNTPFSLVDMKMDADGNYTGLITVEDILNEKYNNAALKRKFHNKIIDFLIRNNMGGIYGRTIEVARLKYIKNQRVEIYPLVEDGKALAKLNNDEWSSFIDIGIAPGVVGRTKFKVLEMTDSDVVLYMAPFFAPSDKASNVYTYPKELSNEISKIADQYIIEVVWGTAHDYMLIPTTKEIIRENEIMKTEVGEQLFNQDDWDLFIQVFSLVDRMQHPTWVFRYGEIPEERFASLNDPDFIRDEGYMAIEEAYIAADKWVGDMMKNIDLSKDVVLIMSDHGFQQGVGRELLYGVHRLKGIYILNGEPVKDINDSNFENHKGPDYSVLDITPNILYLMGIPVAEDMNGKIWLEIYDENYIKENPVTTLDTYHRADLESISMQQIDASAIEQLKGLGYLE